ncbi:MAG: hypothetical protein D3924_01970, partial [Candidatus Electrothrix sp. AR4]|nr:hypothetical protein [Candidatus Electrothrix sp. AR4]
LALQIWIFFNVALQIKNFYGTTNLGAKGIQWHTIDFFAVGKENSYGSWLIGGLERCGYYTASK